MNLVPGTPFDDWIRASDNYASELGRLMADRGVSTSRLKELCVSLKTAHEKLHGKNVTVRPMDAHVG